MSMKVFMKVKDMAGSATEAGRSDWSIVFGFDHLLKYPFNPSLGGGSGEPSHGACTAIKEIDKASPKLYEALAKKLMVASVEFEFERDLPGDGKTEVYFKILLTECRVTIARPHIRHSTGPDDMMPSHLEEIGFAYRKIDWEWLSGGKLPTTFDFNDPKA